MPSATARTTRSGTPTASAPRNSNLTPGSTTSARAITILRSAAELTPDPLGFIDGPNKYLYVVNNPLNLADPYGLSGERKNWFADFFSPFADPRYYYEVGAVMETKFTINMQDLFGQIGFGTAGYANVGYIPKGIGYSNANFLEGDGFFINGQINMGVDIR